MLRAIENPQDYGDLATAFERVAQCLRSGQNSPVAARVVENADDYGVTSETVTKGGSPMGPAPTRIMKEFGDRLAAVRTIAGYKSAESFAKLIDADPHTYRRYERGEVQPKFEVLVDIAKATRCSLHWLLTGEGDARLPQD